MPVNKWQRILSTHVVNTKNNDQAYADKLPYNTNDATVYKMLKIPQKNYTQHRSKYHQNRGKQQIQHDLKKKESEQ